MSQNISKKPFLFWFQIVSLFFTLLLSSSVYANLVVLKITTIPSEPVPGQELIYQIHFDNIHTNACAHPTLHFYRPDHITVNPGVRQDIQLHSITGNNAAYDHGIYSIKVMVDPSTPPGTQMTAQAQVQGTGHHNANCSDLSPLKSTVLPVTPPLNATKTATTNFIGGGEELTYTINYSNTSSIDQTNVTITDTLPTSVNFISASAGGTFLGGTVTWNVGTVHPGGSGSVTVTTEVDNAASGDLTNNGEITSTLQTTAYTFDNKVTATPAATPEPSLSLVKTASQRDVQPGDHLSYSLNYENTGTGPATGVVLTDTLPLGVTFESASDAGTHLNGVVTWNIGTVPERSKGTLIVTVVIDSDALLGDILENNATLSSVELPLVAAPTVFSYVQGVAHYEIQKAASVEKLVQPGQEITYIISYENVGNAGDINVTLSDTLPDNVTFVSATNGGVESNGVVTWFYPSVPVRGIGLEAVTVIVDPSVTNGDLLFNIAGIAGEHSNAPQVTHQLQVFDYPAFILTKTSNKVVVEENDELIYTINYSVVGDGIAHDITLTDDLPLGVTFKSASAGGSHSVGQVTWDLGDLASGSSGSVTLTVTIDAPMVDYSLFHNVAAIISNETPPLSAQKDVLGVNNTPHMSITKTASKPIVKAGDDVVYNISFGNTGTGTATDVVIEDLIPAGLIFKSASHGGVYDNVTNKVTWTIGDVAAGIPGYVTLIGTVRSPAVNGSLLNNTSTLIGSNLQTIAGSIPVLIESRPELTLAKTASANLVVPGDPLTYILDFENIGTDTATNILIIDQLPTNVTFVSATGGGVESNGLVSWNLATPLVAGGMGSVSVTVKVASILPVGSSILNTASIIASGLTPVLSVVKTPVNSAPIIGLTKTASKSVVLPGDTLIYTIEVINTGTADAAGAVLEDHLPTGVIFVSASAGGSETSPGIVTWNLSALDVGITNSVNVTVLVDNPLENGTILHNVASITGPTFPSVSIVDPGVLVHSEAIIELTKMASQTVVLPGDTLFYTLEASNIGTAATAGTVKLKDYLPPEVTFISATAGGVETNGVVTWDIGVLHAGVTSTVNVTVRVNSPLPNGTVLYNAAITEGTVVPVSTIDGGVQVNSAPAMNLTKTASKSVVVPGDTLVYTIEVLNKGTANASSVVLEDHLPDGVSFISASDNGYESSPGVVVWQLGIVDVGIKRTVSVTVVVNSVAEGTILNNVASITGPLFPPVAVHHKKVLVHNTPILEVNKTVSSTYVTGGDQIVYTLEYQNSGNANAAGVILEDHLPAGVTFVSASGGGSEASPGIVEWNLGTLNVGVKSTVTVTVDVDNALIEGTVLHNSASIYNPDIMMAVIKDVIVHNQPVMTVVKSASRTEVRPGQKVSFTLDYANIGTVAASNVVLEDHLPDDFIFISASDDGIESGGIVQWNIATVGAGVSGSVTVTVETKPDYLIGQTLHNSASIVSTLVSPVSYVTDLPLKVVPVKHIPTMSAWGLGILVGLLGLMGFVRRRKA